MLKSTPKKSVIFALLFCVSICGYGQSFVDSFLTKYNSYTKQNEKEYFLTDYLQNTLFFDNKFKEKSIALISKFKQQGNELAVDFCNIIFVVKAALEEGNYSDGLRLALPILQRFEKRENKLGIALAFKSISYCYRATKDFEQSMAYQKKIIPLAISLNNEKLISQTYNDIGTYYAKMQMPDSGLVYAQKGVALGTKINYEEGMPYFLSTVAENYMASKDYDLAIPFLRRAFFYANKMSNATALGFLYNDCSEAFLGIKQYDSAAYYAKKAVAVNNAGQKIPALIYSYKLLTRFFEATNQLDSANKYFRLAVMAKDTLYTMEKTRLFQSLGFTEQLRQQEIENDKLRQIEDRKHNIQYALIAIGIISFIILFLLLSRSTITNTKVITFLSVLALLVVFEFLNLLLHPFLENITNHSPLLMLLALVGIAALLIPLHHKLEKWTTNKLVEKNKAIRLANAKKTIEELE